MQVGVGVGGAEQSSLDPRRSSNNIAELKQNLQHSSLPLTHLGVYLSKACQRLLSFYIRKGGFDFPNVLREPLSSSSVSKSNENSKELPI